MKTPEDFIAEFLTYAWKTEISKKERSLGLIMSVAARDADVWNAALDAALEAVREFSIDLVRDDDDRYVILDRAHERIRGLRRGSVPRWRSP